jgi:hypothetical protein
VLNTADGETVSVLALIAVLACEVIRPRGWPEAVAATARSCSSGRGRRRTSLPFLRRRITLTNPPLIVNL